MTDENKSNEQLIKELQVLRQRVAELEASKSQLRQYEEILKVFRTNMPIGLFIIQDGRFKFVNDNLRTLLADDADEIIESYSMKLVYPEDRERVREAALKILHGESAIPYKYRIVNKDGQIRWLLESVASIQYQGKRAILGHAMDITESEMAQEKLEEAYEKERRLRQELEIEVQRRVEFTRALVHELKTPLTPIMSSSDLLVSGLTEEPWLSVAQNIQRGAINLNRRIGELLDLARGEIGMLRLNPKRVDVLKLLQHVGSEMSAGVRNVFVENCRLNSPNLNEALRFKTNAVRGGTIEHIHFRNIEIGEVGEAVLQIDFQYEEGENGPERPNVHDIDVRNVTCKKSKYALEVRGFRNAPIRDLRLADCTFDHIAEPNIIEHVEGLTCANVKINGETFTGR